MRSSGTEFHFPLSFPWCGPSFFGGFRGEVGGLFWGWCGVGGVSTLVVGVGGRFAISLSFAPGGPMIDFASTVHF